jgi:hypothetical protein
MRKLVLAGLLLGISAPAFADISGTYDVKFEDVSTNCTTQKLAYQPQQITVKVKGNQVSVDIDRTPLMTGVPQKNGKVSAKSKAGNTMIDGMKGVFSVAGRITNDGSLLFVMVGEFTNEQGKPLCSQSWNVSGPRVGNKPDAKKK